MKYMLLLPAFLFASTLAADITVTSVTPSEGPVAGGTTVIVRGAAFSNAVLGSPTTMGPPAVIFGSTEAASVRYIDENTLEVKTPPHLPTTTSVSVYNRDATGSATLDHAFTFTGDPQSAFDPILFPVFLPPVDGAFGSRFETTARVSNRTFARQSTFYGVDTSCYLFTPTTGPYDANVISQSRELLTGCSRSIGRVFWVRRSGTPLVANLRVRDTSRQASSHGVEVPVVQFSDFTNDRIVLMGVPADPRFRKMLRVYSLDSGSVFANLSFNGQSVSPIFLKPSASIFEPAYTELDDFPTNLPAGSTMEVSLTSPNRIWAFISVTNNDTQEITLISPQP
jgi:IPT/TIG domain-containing protein